MKRLAAGVGIGLVALAAVACTTAVPTTEPTAVPVEVPTEVAAPPTEAAATDELAGTRWNLATLQGAAPISGTQVTLNFGTDGTVSGSDGCNRYATTYTVDGASLTFKSPIAGTMMACEEAIMKQGTDYTSALASVAAYTVVSDTLALSGVDGAELLTFSAQSQALAGSSWSATGYNNGKQAVVSIAVGTEITITFGVDGTLTGFGGCNSYSAPYEAEGGAIAIGEPASTDMACPEPAMSQETEYLAALPTAATYAIEADTLELRAADGALAATYERLAAE